MRTWGLPLVFLAPVLAAILAFRLDPFEPAPMPLHELSPSPMVAPQRNHRMLHGAEFVGAGKLPGPEDIAYDSRSGIIYTGCADGWIKKVRVNDSAVENWVNTGGRPLGLIFGHNNELLVADSYKGLLKIRESGEMELLTDEAEGVKFKLTDALDVAKDGTIYFTDASYKYDFHSFLWDILEGKPHGRLMSYDPVTKQTKVLVRDLYFANGVVLSPDQDFVIFCETSMRRCRKYYIDGVKKGRVEKFTDNLPGTPDNIRSDGEGHYWIALSTEVTRAWELSFRYPLIRKAAAILLKYNIMPSNMKNGGVLEVDLEGKPVAHFFDLNLSLISTGLKIGNHLYCGSVYDPHIIRLNLDQYAATSSI